MNPTRRDFLKFLGYGSVLASNSAILATLSSCNSEQLIGLNPSFKDDVLLAKGLKYSLIMSWGDKINEKEVFGFNNDYIDYSPISSSDLIMWVNHEYLHPIFVSSNERSKENVEKEMKLVGGSLVRVKKQNGSWKMIPNDQYNRGVRGDTPIPFANGVEIHGKKEALGTLGNCAGGKTPWGNILTCEENYHLFYGERQKDGSVSDSMYSWQTFYPNPPEHYGWVVEINPKTGEAQKHTNLGRFAHECATCTVGKTRKVVVYSGDDKNSEHLYKFVSESGNDFKSGTLYVADIENGKWLPLDMEKSPILKKHFKSQIDVMIEARAASKTLGATELDRPEDIEIHPYTGDVFVALTNNKPKGNYHGQILKIKESNGDHESLTFESETFLTGGKDGGLSCPDNLAFDRKGNLWITTDISGSSIGNDKYKKFGNNGLFVVPISGKDAGKVIQIASAPVDAEFTGPKFSPDYKTLFLSVQHPGETTKDLKSPTSNWPTGKMPKPSVIAIEGETLERLTHG